MSYGIHVKKSHEYLDKFVQNAAELRLLGRGDGTEVMLQKN